MIIATSESAAASTQRECVLPQESDEWFVCHLVSSSIGADHEQQQQQQLVLATYQLSLVRALR